MSPDRTPCQIEKSSARIASETFVNAVSTLYSRCDGDFIKFCSLLDLKTDKYAQENWRLFNELIERLNSFDMRTLTKIVEAGFPLSEAPGAVEIQSLVQPPSLAEPPPAESSAERSP